LWVGRGQNTVCPWQLYKMTKKKKKNRNSKKIVQPIPSSVLKKNLSSDNTDKQTERILNILNVEDEEYAAVNENNVKIYTEYLKSEIEVPCTLTGIEDTGCFSWEEYYTFGPGNKIKYEKLKKKRASYTDEYTLIRIDNDYDNLMKKNPSNVNERQPDSINKSLFSKILWPLHAINNFRQTLELITYVDGENRIYAKVQRISDEKEFILTLEDLKAVEKSSKNFQLLDDYAVWFVNN